MCETSGEIDAKQILDNELRILVLEGMMNFALTNLPPGMIQQSDIDKIRTSAVEQMQKKYPNSGISSSLK